jgi:NAD(P)-dependent dehydrogenase (short-subunit alcohol dehydrogenase family)
VGSSELAGKTAVVTGAGRGIGAATARALAEAGAAVVLAARSEREIEDLAQELRAAGGKALAVPCDVAAPEQIRALRGRVASELGAADILINNAGYADSAPLHRITVEEWDRIFAVNVRGTFLCTQAFVPGMIERGWGRVVNVASIAGKMGAAYIAAYASTKHAVIGFTRAVAAEMAEKGITVNAVCPGYVDTPMTDVSVRRIVEKTRLSPDEVRESFRRASPQKRLFDAAEVAYLILSLCDPRARGVNGQAIVLDGGGVQS